MYIPLRILYQTIAVIHDVPTFEYSDLTVTFSFHFTHTVSKTQIVISEF